jgi:squalene synthase HpnC
MAVRVRSSQTAVSQAGSQPAAVLAEPHGVVRRARDENFPVALRVLPRATRMHLLAIYGFARLADDTGDEAPGDRLAQLDALEAELDRAFAGRASHPVFVRLQATIMACDLDPEPFRALIEANRRDQTVHRYATWDDLRGYCALSADPVGRLVLAVFGASTPANCAWSDDVCTALQLVEHVQDLGEDYARGRVYVPADDLVRFQCPEGDLGRPQASPALRAVVEHEVARARALLVGSGRPLCARLRGWGRLAVAGFVAGGLAALDAIERADHDVLASAVRPSRAAVARHAVRLLIARSPSP